MLKDSLIHLKSKIKKIDSLNDKRMKFNGLMNFYNKNEKRPIFICTSARSGSTWLMEIIASAKGLRYVSQPLDKENFHTKIYDLEPTWEFLYSSEHRKKILKKYMYDLISGKISLQFPHQFWDKGYDVYADRIVFKIIFGLDLISWFEKNFDPNLVYLIRHPIPTVISRIKYDWPISYTKNILENKRNVEIFPSHAKHFGKKILKNGSQIEKYTLQWCLENYFLLKYSDDKDWFIVTYEELVLKPEDIIIDLIKQLNLENEDYDRMVQCITKKAKSPMTQKETEQFLEEVSIDDDRSYLIKKWKNEIDDKQENKVFDIIEKFDIEIYQKNIFLPSAKYLHNF